MKIWQFQSVLLIIGRQVLIIVFCKMRMGREMVTQLLLFNFL